MKILYKLPLGYNLNKSAMTVLYRVPVLYIASTALIQASQEKQATSCNLYTAEGEYR